MTPMLPVAAVAVSSLLLAGSGAAPHGRPVFSKAPQSAAPASRHDHACQVDGTAGPTGAAGGSHGAVWVRPDPTGVTAEWIPGLDNRRATCHTRLTTAGTRRADRLASRIEQAAKVAHGSYACPEDDGTAVELWFHYAGGRDEYVEVSLSGCRFVVAPQRWGRWESAGMTRTLQAMAPREWKSATQW